MRISGVVSVPPPRAHHAEAHVWVTALCVSILWLQVLWVGAPRLASGTLTPAWATVLGLATQWVCVLLEAAGARILWLAAGASPSWGALTARIFVASAAEAFAAGVLVGAPELPAPVAIALCGVRADPGFLALGGADSAFAAFGGLTVLRLVVSAHAQARLARASFGRGMLVVVGLYLATRLALWWAFDLLQGRSFVS